MPTNNSLDGLNPEFKTKLVVFEGACLKNSILVKFGVTVRRVETVRSLVTQMAYRSRSLYQDIMDGVKGSANALVVEAAIEPVLILYAQAMYKAAGLYQLGDQEALQKITSTLQSKHIEGKAADYVPTRNGKDWWDAPDAVWEAMWQEAEKLGITCGGRWKDFQDKPHLQWDK